MENQLSIAIVSSDVDIALCQTMRRMVFIDEQDVSEAEEIDGQDPICTHILATQNGKPVGAARYQYIADAAKIQRVCVLNTHRGKGYGARIIQYIIKQVKTENRANTVRLGSQIQALAFYEKLGFTAFGPEYLDANILHQDMEKELQ